MRFSAFTVVACFFAASVAALPVADEAPDACPLAVGTSEVDSACFKKLRRDEEVQDFTVCPLGVDSKEIDSACFKVKRDQVAHIVARRS